MKKLFLTSFVFKTGDQEYKEYRLVVVTSNDVKNYTEAHKNDTLISADPELSCAHDKFNAWFPDQFPESEMMYHICHPAIT